jgi:hypothetical protein
MKNLKEMTPSEINKALDKIDSLRSKCTQALIDAGRGSEKSSEIRTKKDPLSLHFCELEDKYFDLRTEVYRRVGPGFCKLPARHR